MVNAHVAKPDAPARLLEQEQARLIRRYEPLVRQLAYQLTRRHPHRYQDACADGLMGLWKAAKDFDPTRGVDFISYAKTRIRGEIIDELRKTYGRRSVTGGYSPPKTINGESPLVIPLGVTVDEIGVTEDALGVCLSLFETAESDPQAVLAEREESAALTAQLNQVFLVLPPNQRQVLLGYYVRSQTLLQIADTLGVTESRASQLHKKALASFAELLRVKRLAAQGVHIEWLVLHTLDVNPVSCLKTGRVVARVAWFLERDRAEVQREVLRMAEQGLVTRRGNTRRTYRVGLTRLGKVRLSEWEGDRAE